MRARDMHTLCCISIDCPGTGARSTEPATPPHDGELPPPKTTRRGLPSSSSSSSPAGVGVGVGVAGVLYKWTNIGKGWRHRWFSLENGVLSYSKFRASDSPPRIDGAAHGVRLIGSTAESLARAAADGRKRRKPTGRVVRLEISSFRESKSDNRKFYIFAPTRTLHLRTDSSFDRVAWIEALTSARGQFSINGGFSSLPQVPFSAAKLRDRMRAEGLGEALINDCVRIMQLEFSEYQKQLRLQFHANLSFLDTFQLRLETANTEDIGITISECQLQLTEDEFPISGHETYYEYSNTESSDEVEKQELDEYSDEDELLFFDANECFGDNLTNSALTLSSSGYNMNSQAQRFSYNEEILEGVIELSECNTYAHVKRRIKLPEPLEKEKSVSLWSMIKDNVGKDLTRVCLPVYFNEPLSSLQKCFEDLEYSYLLDRAYEYGKTGNSLMRILNVAAFAVSGYSSCDSRLCKPFNPLLGETYEADYPEKGIRFFAEKVSHHPMLIACHCEGKGWKYWGDSNLKSKFWGQSIQLDPVGVLTLEFDDGEIFQWSKVTTTINNLIIGKVCCNHHGIMNIRGNMQYSCKLKFKEQSLLDRNSRQVRGSIEDAMGKKVATLIGRWDDSMYYTLNDEISSNRNSMTQSSILLWKRNKPPPDPTRYNLTSFAISLNELTWELQEKLPPTDSRLRPDQRYLENGEYEKANAEKLRLERRQRMSTKLQENGWKPRWFRKDGENGTFRYIGGYWEAREQKQWDDCLQIFAEISDPSKLEL